MELDAREILKTYFKIQKSKSIPESRKNKLCSHLKNASQSLRISDIKNAACKEMVESSSNVYKLFCQSIILMGKIN